MAAKTITLPDHVADWIDEQVAAGKFASDDDVVVDLVQQAMSPRIDWNDDPELLEAIAEIERGEGIVVTDITAYFEKVSREASDAVVRGEEIRDDLKY